jgi:hypothetical protein
MSVYGAGYHREECGAVAVVATILYAGEYALR